MPNGAHGHLSTPRARDGEPQPAPTTTAGEPASARRDLTSWWKQFSKRNVKKEDEKEPEVRGIFGVPLITSIPYANVAISLFNETGESYIYGYVPIVVAKCGVFLKEKATDVEGIFRLAGSEKRIKELKTQFDTPPRWGKGLDWTGYTVHDAANILRRYFNQLPEPIIPLQHYDQFRQPLRNHQAEAVGHIEGQSPSVGGFNPETAVHIYQRLIKELPSLNRQLLLYILDLLAVFAAKSDVNKMTTSNLAAIFQPGILSHPQHDMSPQDYRLSQDVLIFLIDNQDHFLIGMEGTAVDEGTVKHVESGPSTPQARTPTTPGRNKSGLGRSTSTSSSAGAESLRKFGGVRRNVSASSRHSRHSGALPSPTTSAFNTPTGSGVHRSNTLPSKRSPAIPGARFPKEKTSEPSTPAPEEAKTGLPPTTPEDPSLNALQPSEEPSKPPAPNVVPPKEPDVVSSLQEERIELSKPTPTDVPGAYPLPSPGVITPGEEINPMASASVMAAQALAPPTSQQHDQRSPQLAPTQDKSESAEGSGDKGTVVEPSPTVRTFTQILSKVSPSGDEKKDGRRPNKLQKKQRMPSSTNPSAHSSTHSLTGHIGNPDGPPSPLPPPGVPYNHSSNSKEAFQSYNTDTVSSRNSGATLKPNMSPSASFRSHSTATEYSEADPFEDSREDKKGFWKGHRRGDSKATPTASQTDLSRSVPEAETSVTSLGSGNRTGRRSLQYDSHQASEATTLYGAETEEQKKKGHFNWLRGKMQEHKDREAKKQHAKSPPGSSSDLITQQNLARPDENVPVRGKSMDVPRTATSEGSRGSSSVTPTGPAPNPLATTVPSKPNPNPTPTPNPVPDSKSAKPEINPSNAEVQASGAGGKSSMLDV